MPLVYEVSDRAVELLDELYEGREIEVEDYEFLVKEYREFQNNTDSLYGCLFWLYSVKYIRHLLEDEDDI